MKKKLILLTMLAGAVFTSFAQKVFSEGEVHYAISVVEGTDKTGVGKAFSGAKQVLYIKGYKARIDFISSLRNQSTVYDAQTGTGFIMRQAGNEKYLITLNKNQWQDYNRRYSGVTYTKTSETKEVLGYTCNKAVGKLSDGSEIEVWYAPSLDVMAKGYDLAFANLDGLPLMFTVNNGAVTLQYKATDVKTTLVNTASLEMPKSGYRLLEYQGN